MSNYKSKLEKIKGFAFDVDGVFTDGSLLVQENGDMLRIHNAKDGFALRWAKISGYKLAIVTGADSPTILKRFQPVGIEHIYLKSRNKLPDFLDFCKKEGLTPEEVAFVGDDIPDIPVLKHCGLAVCPADAAEEVKEICDYVSIKPGGKGCVRELLEQVMKVHGKWEFDAELYDKKYGK
jgi:3-deoxy-D-manno-octulosonate 8-phosphate phosphatase, YrbI family